MIITVALLFWWQNDQATVLAQSGRVVWSEPMMLSDPEMEAWSSTIAADMAGNIHLVWNQTMTEDPPPGEGDTIFYARWNGQEWTSPVDILVTPDGGATEAPNIAFTSDGMLHVVWQTGGETARVLYSRAPACCADNPKAWSYPVSIGSPVLGPVNLVADPQGRLHLAFASRQTDGIVYRRSDDSGKTWPVWVDLSGGLKRSDDLAIAPRMAVDARERIHLVWTVYPWPGRAVVYARSDDVGLSWSEPEFIDIDSRKDYVDEYGPLDIDLEVKGEDEVHLIWDGAPTVERTHIWSADGGKTWSSMTNPFPQVTRVGRGSFNDMVFDGAGILHAVSLQPNDVAIHASWNGLGWSGTDEIPTIEAAELFDVVVTQGNIFHLTWTDKVKRPFTTWYVQGKIEAPEQALQSLPTIAPTPTSTPTPVAVSAGENIPTPPSRQLLQQVADEDTLVQSSFFNNPAAAVIIGTGVVALLLAISLVAGFIFIRDR